MQPPSWWLRQAECIHEHESRDWHIVNPPYAGGFEFTLGTWREAGGRETTLVAVAATAPSVQRARAFVIWRKRGWSHDWPRTSRICGLR